MSDGRAEVGVQRCKRCDHYAAWAAELEARALLFVGDRGVPVMVDGSDRAPDGITIIAAERRRQTEEEGWDPEHDDGHTDGELAMAAVCYAAPRPILIRAEAGSYGAGAYRDPWPWDIARDKRPRDDSGVLREPTREERRRMLAKAGALIAAELDRMEREGAQGGDDA